MREHSRTKALAEKERKFQQREQLLADKERALESKERSLSDREKKLSRDEKSLQDERKRHTDHVKSSLANLQQQKHESVKENEKFAQLQKVSLRKLHIKKRHILTRCNFFFQNIADAAAELDSLRSQLTQHEPNDHIKEGGEAVQIHSNQDLEQQQYDDLQEGEQDEQEEPPQQTQPNFYQMHHVPYIPQQFHHPAYKYPPPMPTPMATPMAPPSCYAHYQPPFFPVRGYSPYPPPLFPPRFIEPRAEHAEVDENGENVDWREQQAYNHHHQNYQQHPHHQQQVEEDQDQQPQHRPPHPNYVQHSPQYWGAESQ